MRRTLALALLWGAASAAVAGERLKYEVKPGETLWSISAQSDVYADPLLWPVIYKFNRDQIVDPARVYPGQVLEIPIFVDRAAREEARRLAIAEAALR